MKRERVQSRGGRHFERRVAAVAETRKETAGAEFVERLGRARTRELELECGDRAREKPRELRRAARSGKRDLGRGTGG